MDTQKEEAKKGWDKTIERTRNITTIITGLITILTFVLKNIGLTVMFSALLLLSVEFLSAWNIISKKRKHNSVSPKKPEPVIVDFIGLILPVIIVVLVFALPRPREFMLNAFKGSPTAAPTAMAGAQVSLTNEELTPAPGENAVPAGDSRPAAEPTRMSTPTEVKPPTSTPTPTATTQPPVPTFTPTPTFIPTVEPTVELTLIITPIAQSTDAITPQNAKQVGQIMALSYHASQIAWSPDGRYLGILTGQELVILDGKTYEKRRSIGHYLNIRGFAFTPDGARVVTVNDEIIFWNVQTGGQEQVIQRPEYKGASGVALSPDGTLLALKTGDATRLVQVSDGSLITTVGEGHSETAPAFSPTGKQIAIAGGIAGMEIYIYEVPSGRLLRELKGHGNWIKCIVYSSDGRRIASTGVDGRVILWDALTGLPKLDITASPDEQVDGVALSPGGQVAASAAWDLTVKLWDAQSGELLQTLNGPSSNGGPVAFSPDGSAIATGEFNSIVWIWGIKE